ncbi:MAG: ABC transporter substrate-binding protein, partial [Chloroflexota bacterium]
MKRISISIGVILSLVLAACAPQQPAGTSPAPTAAPTAAALPTGEQPKSGGTLVYIVTAEPPTFDAHQSNTFASLQPIAPHYSLLYRLDPADNVSKIVPDVAAGDPQISADKLTWTIKLRTDVKFHDGTALTSEDVRATYQQIISPPQGVNSIRKAVYAAVESVSAPDPRTVVFKLKNTSGSFISSLLSPYNFIYKADILAKDPRWYEK